MGKLVLFLADGTTLDIPLVRERITIGRRADNDICLPYPAVSAEHAAIVTILADSFLEDLGSTNGTLVNGNPVAKHFLRDRDEIEIGRQRLVYLDDDATRIEPPRQAARVEAHAVGDRVAAGAAAHPAAETAAGVSRAAPETTRPVMSGGDLQDVDRFVAAELAADARRGGHPVELAAVAAVAAAADAPAADAVVPVIRVLTGPSAGRAVALIKPTTVIGRVGLQVAAIRRDGAECRLVPIEGAAPPHVNGVPVVADGVVLHTGDVVEIAGTRLGLETVPRRLAGAPAPADEDAAATK